MMRLFRRSLLCLVVGVTAFGAAGCTRSVGAA